MSWRLQLGSSDTEGVTAQPGQADALSQRAPSPGWARLNGGRRIRDLYVPLLPIPLIRKILSVLLFPLREVTPIGARVLKQLLCRQKRNALLPLIRLGARKVSYSFLKIAKWRPKRSPRLDVPYGPTLN